VATVFIPPFYVPRPADDPVWVGVPRGPGAIVLTTTQQKLFWQPGQVGRQPYPWGSYDDPPVWSGGPIQDDAITVTTTQLKLFGQPGQAKSSPYPWQDYDDPPVWWGGPTQSPAITVTRTQLKLFGQPGQAPNKTWSWQNYDDPGPWQDATPPLNQNLLLGKVPFVQSTRQLNYDDPPPWQDVTPPSIHNLLLKDWTTPVQATRQLNYDDAPYWSGEPTPSALLHPLLTSGGPPFRNVYYYPIDDAPYWSGGPLPSHLLHPLLTAGGQVPSSRPTFIDDPASWQFRSSYNALLLSPAAPFIAVPQLYYYDDAPTSLVIAPVRNVPLLTTPVQTPKFIRPWNPYLQSAWGMEDPSPAYPHGPPAIILRGRLVTDPQYILLPRLRQDVVTPPKRRLVVIPTPRFVRPRPTMPQGLDFSVIDVGEIITGTFDFAPWLGIGVTVLSVTSVACAVSPTSTTQDTGAAGRLVGPPSLGVSPSSNLANQAVLQQWGNMVAGVTYRIAATVLTSDNQTLILWAHQPCQALT
jgi:hypothetical protein